MQMAPAVICMCDRCSAVYRLLRSSLRIRWSDITRKQKIGGGNLLLCCTQSSSECAVDWQKESLKILCRCVIALGQAPATGVRCTIPFSSFPWLSTICVSARVIPQSALNYWPGVSRDRGCGVFLSIGCSRDIFYYYRILWPRWKHGWLYHI